MICRLSANPLFRVRFYLLPLPSIYAEQGHAIFGIEAQQDRCGRRKHVSICGSYCFFNTEINSFVPFSFDYHCVQSVSYVFYHIDILCRKRYHYSNKDTNSFPSRRRAMVRSPDFSRQSADIERSEESNRWQSISQKQRQKSKSPGSKR